MTINELETGRSAEVVSVGGEGPVRLHILGMGLIPGAKLKVVKRAPMGDPIELLVNGFSLSLRSSEAAWIEVREIDGNEERPLSGCGADNAAYNVYLHDHNAHPGLG